MRLAIRRRDIPESTSHAKLASARGSAPAKPDEQYAGAFARVRLVRAWIGAAAAMVALGYAFNTLLDRLLR
jgi:hypothetical protein